MKKKILTIALVGLMAASLAACGKANETQTSNAPVFDSFEI